MSADKDARIAELEKDVQVAKGQYQGACDIIKELERDKTVLIDTLAKTREAEIMLERKLQVSSEFNGVLSELEYNNLLAKEREPIERKLAEQQAWMENAWDVLCDIAIQSSMSAVDRHCSKILANPKFDSEELNNLLAKAKEEEREACANACQDERHVFSDEEWRVRCELSDAIRERSNAPKPKGA